MKLEGYAIIVDDSVDTDTIIPARYLHRSDPEWLAQHVFEDSPEIREKILKNPKPIAIIAGKGFGYGSSREHAVLALKAAKVSFVIAENFHRIFYRNAINNGLVVIEANIKDYVEEGDLVKLDLKEGVIVIPKTNKTIRFKPLPKKLLEILEIGGLKQFLKKIAAKEN